MDGRRGKGRPMWKVGEGSGKDQCETKGRGL